MRDRQHLDRDCFAFSARSRLKYFTVVALAETNHLFELLFWVTVRNDQLLKLYFGETLLQRLLFEFLPVRR